MGGFVRELMWDGIDCHRCRMLGWIAVSWDDQSTCSSNTCGRWGRATKIGGPAGSVMGSVSTSWEPGLSYLLASAAFRMVRPPVVLGADGDGLGIHPQLPAADAPGTATAISERFLRKSISGIA